MNAARGAEPLDAFGARATEVGGFWAGPVGSVAQARMILQNASGALFALGVMSLVVSLVLGLLRGSWVGVATSLQGVVLIVLAVVAKKSGNPVFYGVLMGLMLLVAAANLVSLVLVLAGLLTGLWQASATTVLAAGLTYAMYRAMLAARFLKAHPEVTE